MLPRSRSPNFRRQKQRSSLSNRNNLPRRKHSRAKDSARPSDFRRYDLSTVRPPSRLDVGRFLRAASRRSHFVANGPEVMEDGPEERFLQKRNAGRTAGAVFRADRALDQFDVAITPLLQAFIEIGHELEQDRNFGRRFVEL